MTREDDGTFQHRNRCEAGEKSRNTVCVEENEALFSLHEYFQEYPICVIIGTDEDMLAILLENKKIVATFNQ